MDPMNDLLGKLGGMKQKLDDAMQVAQNKVVSATVGAGMVTATANGKQEIIRITIDPTALMAGPAGEKDITMLEDLIVAACNQALSQAKGLAATEMKGMLQGFGLPAGLDLANLDLSQFFPK